MKKALSILLVLVLAFSLFACGEKTDDAQNTTSGNDAGGSDNGGGDSQPSGGAADGMTIGSDEWYATDDYDHSAREPFKIAYICNQLSWVWNRAISDALKELAPILNYDYTEYAANGDFDAYINQIYTYADQGYDGFVIGADDALAPRAYEVCAELGVAFVAESTAFVDDDGNCIWPGVQQAQYANGEQCMQWLVDNYKNYWTDEIDASKLGLIVLDYSAVSGIHGREQGAVDVFEANFPDGTYFPGDLVALGSAGFSVQGGNDMTTSIIGANPQIEKWFIVGLVDDWSTGATRAVESLGMEDKVLVTSVQADAFLKEMEGGYTGSVYVSANAVSSTYFAKLMAANLVTILEGRETAESIWAEWKWDGSEYATVDVLGEMITKDTYQEYLSRQTIG